MKHKLGWNEKSSTSTLVWVYLLIVPIGIFTTNILYHLWTRNLSIRDIAVLASFRALAVYLLSIWFFYRLVQRSRATEKRYETLIQLSPQPVLVQSNGKWVYANPSALRLLGASKAADVIGHSAWDILLEESYESARRILKTLTENGAPTETYVNRKIRRLDGQTIDVEFLAAPVIFDGTPSIQVLYTDVTEKKRLERELHSALTELESFIEHNTGAIVLFDSSGCIAKINTKFEQMCGLSRSECIGLNWYDMPFAKPEHVEEMSSIITEISNGQSINEHQTCCQTAEGSKKPVSLSAFPIIDAQDSRMGWALTIRDISDRLEAEQQLVQSEKLSALGQLAAGVAHEIRNPLTSLLGFLKILPSTQTEKLNEYIGIMTGELERIADIVTEVLFLAKPQAFHYEDVNVAKLVTAVYTILAPEALLRNITFVMQNTTDDVYIYGDENHLKQLLINLVRNAMDALSPTSREVRIESRNHANTIFIDISDTGVGIEQTQLERIFDPFYTTKADGTGLGLHVCRQIVTRHNGLMRFKSEVGKGTTVHLSFPLPAPVRSVTGPSHHPRSTSLPELNAPSTAYGTE